MADDCMNIEEHELPPIEAVLACTLALMTGYTQALQAEVHPRQRLAMGDKVASHLALLLDHPQLSLGFRQVLLGLRTRWRAMGACTLDAARDCAEVAVTRPTSRADDGVERRRAPAKRLH